MDRSGRKTKAGPVEPGSGGNMNRSKTSIARILAVALMLTAGLLLAAALPAQGQTRGAQPASVAPVAAGSMVHPQPRAVVRVNGTVLSELDLLREMYAIFPYAKQHNGGFPRSMEADIRRGALKMIEFEELVYQEAKRRKMTIAPERMAKAEKQFRAQFATEQEYRQFLQAEDNGSLQTLRRSMERSLLIDALLKAEVTDKSWVSMAEAREFYAKNPERFKLAETFTLQSITIMPPAPPNPKQPAPKPTPEQSRQMYARAEDALRQAQATKTYEEFGVLAEKISEDDFRVMMGNHKTVDATELPPEIAKAVSSLRPGQISGLIAVDGAYTIVRLNAHTPARTQKFDEVYNAVRAAMRHHKQDALRRDLDAKLRKTAKIEEL